jgi:hypothetical protein
MVHYLRAYRQSRELASLVQPRHPFRTRPFRIAQVVKESAWDIEELSTLVADIEFDRKGVPILLKQYLKLGGELVAFNVDSEFRERHRRIDCGRSPKDRLALVGALPGKRRRRYLLESLIPLSSHWS